MGWSFYQLLLLLWAFTHSWKGRATAGVVPSSDRPTVQSPRSNAGEGTRLEWTTPDGFHQSAESISKLHPTTAPPARGLSSAPPRLPATQLAQEEQLTKAPARFPTALQAAASAGRVRRSTGALLDRVSTPPNGGGQSLTGNPSSQPKVEVHQMSTQSSLTQMVWKEPNPTSLNPPSHNPTTSSPRALELTTAKLAPTTFMPKTFIPIEQVSSQHVSATTKPVTNRHPGDPTSPTAFSGSTDHIRKTGTFLVTSPALKTTDDITHTSSPITKTDLTSSITVTPSTASATVRASTGSPIPITNPKKTSKPPATKSGAGAGAGAGSSEGPGGGSGAGSVVAGLGGGALLLMLGGIVFILVRKRHFQQRQINDGTWAGPSPFLDGSGAVGDQPRLMGYEAEDKQQDSKRISLMGFFPRGLSRRLSHLKEVDERVLMADITTGSTFGRGEETEHGSNNGIPPDYSQESTQSQNQEPNQDKENQEPKEDQEPNGKQIQTQEDTASTPASPPAEESSAPPPPPLDDIGLASAPSEAQATPSPPQLDENHQASLPVPPPLVLQDVDLGPPVGETDIAAPPPSEICLVPPPAPPLPSST